MDIYMFDGMRVFPITTNGLPDQVENQGPEINDHSEIVWTEYDFCNAPPGYNFRSRIMHHLNGVTSELTDGSFQPQGPANNNDGRVVWGSYDIALSRNIVEIWENGQVSLVTDDGTKPSINERGDIAFHRWEPARSAWNVFLLRDNEFLRLSDDDHWNLVPHLNDRGEAAWSSGNFPDTHIRLLLRYPDADLNCDADVNAFDVEPFIDALIDPERYAIRHPDCDRMLADVNGDGAVDAMDIEPFIQRLLQP